MGVLKMLWRVLTYLPPVWVLVLNQLLFVQVGLMAGCTLSPIVTVEPTKEKVVVVTVEEEVEPFDICAPTDGELSPLRMYGHAFNSKPYGCM